MRSMFDRTAFNQDISGWAVQSVTDMSKMFRAPLPSTRTSAGAWTTTLSLIPMEEMFNVDGHLNVDLGWCVDDSVSHGTSW